MTHPMRQTIQLGLFCLSSFCLPTVAIAEDIIAVDRLSDITPDSWTATTLKAVMQRYNSSQTYPPKTLTRLEFAMLWRRVFAELPESIDPDTVRFRERLERDFAAEIANLPAIEPKYTLNNLKTTEDSEEPSEFIPTVKLEGEALLSLTQIGSGNKIDEEGERDDNLTLGSRIRLNIDTSFYGEDRLRTRLQSNSIVRVDEATGTDLGRLAFQGDNGNKLELSRLEYYFPIDDRGTVYIEGVGGSLNDFAYTFNSYLSGSSKGSISRFAQRNPIYRQGEGSGVGLDYKFNDTVGISVGYLANEVEDPEIGFGNAAYGTILQLNLYPTESIELGLTYVHSHNSIDTGTGTEKANDPFNDNSEAIEGNSFGLQTNIDLGGNFHLGGWVGMTEATALDLPNTPTATILNWAITLGIPDIGGEGNLLGFAIGQPPNTISNDYTEDDRPYEDIDISLHIEGFYRWQMTDNLAVTFGVMTVTNPEGDSDNDDLFVGTIRTTFSF
jgi:hypothetical protein